MDHGGRMPCWRVLAVVVCSATHTMFELRPMITLRQRMKRGMAPVMAVKTKPAFRP